MSFEPLLEKVKSNEASSVRPNSTPSVMPYTIVSLVLKANKNKNCHIYPCLKNLKPASKGCLFAFFCAQAKGRFLVYFKKRHIKVTSFVLSN